ncbi:hypothetical protein DV515_00008828 [Chloebia gouldiae]|uniref:Uncharacterized protein n=1 Tax=Chloebia gouldiae TaxID=44316 RepID=A0A3L8SDK3_CHLGU|nr:hypothetical protein DV515_00008828 [Chloebia gouldiae]
MGAEPLSPPPSLPRLSHPHHTPQPCFKCFYQQPLSCLAAAGTFGRGCAGLHAKPSEIGRL